MSVITGSRYTTHQSTETRNVRDVKAAINLLEPDSYPLVAIMNKAKNRLQVCGSYKYEWFEDALLPRFDVLGSTELSASATSMIVTNYAYFRKGDLVRVNKGEIVYVTATPSTTTVAIRRAFGTTSAAIAAAGCQLHILANISDEGDTVGSYLTTQKVPKYNYTTLYRTPFAVSGTAQASDVYGKSDLDFESSKALIEHAKSIELVNLLGELKLDTTNETRMSVSQGILSFVTTNSKSVATLTESEMEDYVRTGSRYGLKKKVMVCSSKLLTIINGFQREKLITTSDESTYGVTMAEYKSAGRRIMLVEHPLLENDSLTDLTGLAGTGIMLDIADLSYRHLKGRYMKRTIVNPSSDSTLLDGSVGEILTEGGIQLEQEKKHSELTGVTA